MKFFKGIYDVANHSPFKGVENGSSQGFEPYKDKHSEEKRNRKE